MLELFLGYFLIFAARVADVTMGTVRTILIVRGKSLYAAAIGFCEVLIYIIALQQVIGNLNNWISLFFYAAGFATGNLVGTHLEEKLALGFSTVQIVSMACPLAIAQKLRNEGFGVTVMQGQGKEGDRFILNTYLRRKDLPNLIKIVEALDSNAFVTIMDARALRGGFGLFGKNK